MMEATIPVISIIQFLLFLIGAVAVFGIIRMMKNLPYDQKFWLWVWIILFAFSQALRQGLN